MKIAGIDYEINWRAFTKGKSLFFPCLDYRKEWKALRPELKRLGLDVVHKGVVDPKSGIRGLRIWRL